MDQAALAFENARKWGQWLKKNHKVSKGIWLELRKKDSEAAGVTHAEALDVALCYGWIDGQVRKGDERTFAQRFVPRTKKSIWSVVNREHVARLTEAGLMQSAGVEEVKRAKEDGRWDAAYEPQSRAKIPADLQAALDGNPAAAQFFEKLDSKNRYAILFRLQLPKRAETRARKLEEFVKMLEEGRTLH